MTIHTSEGSTCLMRRSTQRAVGILEGVHVGSFHKAIFSFLSVGVGLHHLLRSMSLKCALACFSFCLCDTQTTPHFCIVMCDHPRAAIDSTRKWQQAAGLLTSNGKLFVCVFMWSVRPERPSVAECPPQPEQTRQDRTSHFLQPPLVKLPIFTPVALELLCLSLWATSWWHSVQQTQQVDRRKLGVRQRWEGVGEQIKSW